MEFIIEVEILRVVLSVICDKEIFLFFYSCTFVGFEKKEEQATNSGMTKYRFFTFYIRQSYCIRGAVSGQYIINRYPSIK
jgi:hypothetical protein